MNNPNHEVDFLVQRENKIYPVEVKSGLPMESKSLKKFKELYADDVGLRLRFSLNTLRLDNDLLNIPMFMADYVDRLIVLAEKKQ
jgi:hypothetical protein